MEFDLVNGAVLISLGLFVLLVGLSVFGLIIAGSMLATAIAMISKREENVREIRRFNAMILDLQNTNRLWFGHPEGAGLGFDGLQKAVEAMEGPQMGGEIDTSDMPCLSDEQRAAAADLIAREFLEDRD